MRIVALQPSVSITLARLERLDDLIGCTKWCLDAVPELRQRRTPVVKDSWSSTADEILALKPELVIASVPYRMESLAAILKAGAPVLALAPHRLADIYRDICLIGGVVSAAAQARKIADEMKAEIESIREQAFASMRSSSRDSPNHRPLVYCEEWGKPLIRSQEWVRELVTAAGGGFQGEPGTTATAAEIAETDPEVVLMAWCGAGNRVPLRRVVEQRGWQNLRAVRGRRVYCIADELLNTPAPTLVDGLRAIAAALYPDYFDSAGIVRLPG